MPTPCPRPPVRRKTISTLVRNSIISVMSKMYCVHSSGWYFLNTYYKYIFRIYMVAQQSRLYSSCSDNIPSCCFCSSFNFSSTSVAKTKYQHLETERGGPQINKKFRQALDSSTRPSFENNNNQQLNDNTNTDAKTGQYQITPSHPSSLTPLHHDWTSLPRPPPPLRPVPP